VVVDARGAMERLSLDAHGGTAWRRVAVGHAVKRGAQWSGSLSTLRLVAAKGRRGRSIVRRVALGRSQRCAVECMPVDAGGGALCASADWPRAWLDVPRRSLPLDARTPWLPPRDDGRPWLLHGEVAFGGNCDPVGNAWRGSARVTSASGGLRNSERSRSDLISYDHCSSKRSSIRSTLSVTLGTTFNEGRARRCAHRDRLGRLRAAVRRGLAAHRHADVDGAAVARHRRAHGPARRPVALGGTRAQPTLGGRRTCRTSRRSAAARDRAARRRRPPGCAARRHGAHRGHDRSGEGTLRVDGTLGWRGDDTPLVLNVTGTHVLAATRATCTR
jgi:translocation and assembly module TamB